MRFLRWWWPLYVFLFPLIFVPWERNVLGSNYNFHVSLTAIFLIIGALVEGFSNPQLSIIQLQRLPSYLWQNKPILWGLLLGVWAVAAAFFAPEPTFALMGTLPQDGFGALHIFALSLLFVLIVARAKHDRVLLERLIWAMVVSGVVLASIATFEALTRHGLIYQLDYDLFPKATLPQRGHFAGFVIVALSLGIGLWLRRYLWAVVAVFVTSFSIGLTLTRTALLTALVASAIGVVFSRFSRVSLLALVVAVLGLGSGMKLIQTYNLSGVQAKFQRTIGDGTTTATRLLYWKTAVRGILARPIFGWGAGGFDYSFADYMSKAEQEKFLQLEMGYSKLIRYIRTPGTAPVFIARDPQGKVHLQGILLWRCHNQFLDVGLRLGLPGLVLYLLLMLGTLRGLLELKPASLALWAYHIFLFFWFVPFHTEGVLWVLMACANLENMTAVLPKTRDEAQMLKSEKELATV